MIQMWENEWYFFLALGVGILLLIYWLKHLGKRFLTGGIFLWDEGGTESRLSSRIAIRKLPLSFYLEAAAVLLLACGAAGLVSTAKADFPPAVVVLNNAYSMEGESKKEASGMLRKYLGRFPGRRVIWLRCGKDVELLSNSDRHWEFERFWECCEDRFDGAKAAAYAGKNFPGAEIIMVSDRVPEHFSKGWTLLLAGRAGGNIAISNARIKGERVLLEISSFADSSMNVHLKVNDRPLDSFELKKDEHKIFNFRLPVPQKMLKFTIASPGDLLECDNEVLLLKMPEKPVTYRIGESLSVEEKTLLSAVLKDNPDFKAVSQEPEVFIERFSKEKRKDKGHKLFFHKGKSPRLLSQSPFFRDNEKILEGLNSSSLKWCFYQDVKIPGKGIIFSSGQKLFSMEKRSVSGYAFHLNLAAGFSNLHALPFWPGFFCNLAEFCRRNRPGPREVNLRSGELLVCSSSAEKGKLAWESKEEKGEVPISEGKTMLQLKKKGLYTLSDGKERFTLSVNPQISSLSDLRSCRKAASYCDLEKLERGSSFKKVSWIFIAGALLLLVFDYCWNCRSRK